MPMLQPKPYLDKLKLRHKPYGEGQRLNMSRIILENQSLFPKPIEYSDIDTSVYDWIREKLKMSYEGKRLPVYKLYSTQRISEYLQNWNELDDSGSVVMNFLTVTRETNPQKGEIYGNDYNIPGHRNYAMFYVPVLQENGTEAYDKYTMKQPFGVNFTYSISIITNKMELLNKMNEKMLYEFSAINAYLFVNGHPMSMSLKDISDDSEYAIDDRKYYSQTYKVLVRGYIIRREDYQVERVPSRLVMSWKDSDASGIVTKRGRNRDEWNKVQFMDYEDEASQKFRLTVLEDESCDAPEFKNEPHKPSEIYEVVDDADYCCDEEDPRYKYKVMRVVMKFDECSSELSFIMDKEMVINGVELDNVHDFRLFVNEEPMIMENEFTIYKDDKIRGKITRENLHNDSILTLVGYDPNTMVDTQAIEETTLDEKPTEEEIIVNPE